MRAIKAAAYENAVYQKYTRLREAELHEQKKFRSRFAINSWTVHTLTGESVGQCDCFTDQDLREQATHVLSVLQPLLSYARLPTNELSILNQLLFFSPS